LVELNTAARGGAAAIEAVRVFDSDIRIVEPEFSVDGRYVATRDGRMRVDILVGGERVFTEALGPSGGWSWTPDQGVAPASPRGAAALRHGIELPFKLHPDTGLIERDRQLRALQVDVDPVPQMIETEYSDYRPVGGVLFPHRQVERAVASGETLATVSVRAIRLNAPVKDAHFLAP